MLTVETIRKIRLSVHRDGKSIRQTSKDPSTPTQSEERSGVERPFSSTSARNSQFLSRNRL